MNRTMKRGLSLLLILCLALSLAACGKGGDTGSSQPKPGGPATPAPDFVYAAAYKDIHSEGDIAYSPELICDNGFLLSYIKDMLLPVQKSEISVSKYCMARQVGCSYNG